MSEDNERVYKIVIIGLTTALCYVAFTFLKIPIPTLGDDMVALHIGNAFCALAVPLSGGWHNGVAGAPSMTIVDTLDPVYITSTPKTFVLRLCIGLIAGFTAHRIAKITEDHDSRYIFKWSLIASIASLGLSVIMDPIVGYFYKNYVLGAEPSMAKVMSIWAADVIFINAMIGTTAVVVIYMVVQPVLKKAGLFLRA